MKTVYDLLLAAQFISAVFVFVSLYFVTAGYGRHGGKKWGPAINPRIGWMVMESPVVFIPLYFLLNRLILNYREHILAWVWKTRIMQMLKMSKLYSAYQAVSGWGGKS